MRQKTQVHYNLNKREMYFSHIKLSLEVSSSGLLGSSKVVRELFLVLIFDILALPAGPRWLLELPGCEEKEGVKRDLSKTLSKNCS